MMNMDATIEALDNIYKDGIRDSIRAIEVLKEHPNAFVTRTEMLDFLIKKLNELIATPLPRPEKN